LIPYDSVDAIKVSEEAVLSTENVGLGKSPIFNLGQVDSSVLVTIILTLTVINYFFILFWVVKIHRNYRILAS